MPIRKDVGELSNRALSNLRKLKEGCDSEFQLRIIEEIERDLVFLAVIYEEVERGAQDARSSDISNHKRTRSRGADKPRRVPVRE